ncbi:hypothetical protein OsccyDRAFT_0392 [Leptolyngbyaceae cyanobacterium JSC-12]|nr:hypothetical protein OsccyDRAFT_0392 [Leptolyngbyaceae cyanobacterium JSC-12]
MVLLPVLIPNEILTMFSLYYLTRFPLWKFLKQPVFSTHYRLVLDPYRFWRNHQVDLLERCLMMNCASGDVRRD